jgi:hypothetical protein
VRYQMLLSGVPFSSPLRAAMAAASILLRIFVEPTPSGRKWRAWLDDRLIVISSWPFVMSARLLVGEGYPMDSKIEMWRLDAASCALRGRLGTVARTLIDGERRNGPETARPFAIQDERRLGPTNAEILSLPRFWPEE